MIIRDRKFNRFKEYHTNKTMTADHISRMMAEAKGSKKEPRYQKVLISYDHEQIDEEHTIGEEVELPINQVSMETS